MKALKERLLEVKENDYQAPDHAFELVLEMLEQIGSTDAELRDDLIYSTLANWILNGVLTPEELVRIVPIILDDRHLFYQIGENGEDSVFTRSFSVLIVPLLLIAHRNHPFLTEEQVSTIKEAVFHYVLAEKDLRGFVGDKGWAHAIAHAADALDDLALCSELSNDDLMKILSLVQLKISAKERVFTDDEDERMVTAIISVWQRNMVSIEEISHWVRIFAEEEEGGSEYEQRTQRINRKNFLRSLYFRLQFLGIEGMDRLPIEEVLRKLGNRYYS